jgi:hypothetical protein
MEHRLGDLPLAARPVVGELADVWARTGGLSWAYGQGSVFSGFTAESDLDFIVIWDRMPEMATAPVDSSFAPHRDLTMEQCRMGGYDIDIQHVSRRVFDEWVGQLGRGEGWSGDQWPMPVHVAAGLAHGLLLCDPRGAGTQLQARLQTPEPQLVEAVAQRLARAAPAFVKELTRARTRADLWLHDLLAVRWHKLIYTAWFLAEGHYPPFPKHLGQWMERLGMNEHARRLETYYWAAPDDEGRDAALADLAASVAQLSR